MAGHWLASIALPSEAGGSTRRVGCPGYPGQSSCEGSELRLSDADVTPSAAERDEIDGLGLHDQEQGNRAALLRARPGENLDRLTVRERNAGNRIASQPSITQSSNRHASEAASIPAGRQLRTSSS